MAPSNPLISHAGRRVLRVLGYSPLPHSTEFYTQKRKNQMKNDIYKLSIDDRKDKPFHCEVCGNTYEPCVHWNSYATEAQSVREIARAIYPNGDTE